VVPLLAIVRHRARVAPKTPALLVYSARTWDEIIFRDELFDLEASDANFDLTLTTTREPRQRPHDFDRRLDRPLLHEIVRRWRHVPRHAYVCGSNAFVEAATSALVADGVPAAIVRAERYGGSDPSPDR
jgi:ferredoxin-NADP reductase